MACAMPFYQYGMCDASWPFSHPVPWPCVLNRAAIPDALAGPTALHFTSSHPCDATPRHRTGDETCTEWPRAHCQMPGVCSPRKHHHQHHLQ